MKRWVVVEKINRRRPLGGNFFEIPPVGFLSTFSSIFQVLQLFWLLATESFWLEVSWPLHYNIVSIFFWLLDASLSLFHHPFFLV